MCSQGAPCSSFAPGHAVHLIQARLVSATPREWVDAIVEHSDAQDGVVVVRTLDAGSDKPLKFADLGPEENPALGVRGIRIAEGDPSGCARL